MLKRLTKWLLVRDLSVDFSEGCLKTLKKKTPAFFLPEIPENGVGGRFICKCEKWPFWKKKV